jgi:hypothetical protein
VSHAVLATAADWSVSLPQEAAVARLIDEMARRHEPVRGAPDAVVALPEALGARRTADG